MSRPLHVVQFTEDFLPPAELTGGVRVSVDRQIRELARTIEVTVVAPRLVLPPFGRYAADRQRQRADRAAERAAGDPPGIRVLRPPYLHVPYFWFFTEPLQLLLLGVVAVLFHARGAQIVHGHRIYPMGLAAALVGAVLGLPAIVTSHGSGMHTYALHGSWRVRTVARLTLRLARRVITVSRELEEIGQRLGVAARRICYIPNGVDMRAFVAHDPAAARRAFGVPEGVRVLLCAGYFHRVKGHEVLLEAFALLRRRRQDVLLLLAGDGPLEERIREQAHAAALDDCVRFLGPVPHPRMPELLAAADLGVLPSWNEGTPLAALEALAMRKPVVGTAVGGTKEVVKSGCHGLLVAPGDAPALAAALDAALDRAWDGECLRRRAEDFAWPSIARRLIQVYHEVLGETGAPPPAAGATQA